MNEYTPALMTAAELLREIERRGGRVLRMRESGVFVLTKNSETAQWLADLGARFYRPQWADPVLEGPIGGYKTAPDGPTEWDLWIHIVPVAGEETIWEAAGSGQVPVVEPVDFR